MLYSVNVEQEQLGPMLCLKSFVSYVSIKIHAGLPIGLVFIAKYSCYE